MSKPARKPKNLLLDANAVAQGERYSERHGTNLSRLVGDFLRALPSDKSAPELSPVVRRLRGIAAGATTGQAAHREHLYRKYRTR